MIIESTNKEYYIDNTKASQIPSPFVIQGITNDVIFQRCHILKCWALNEQFSPVYISLISGSASFINFFGERCKGDYNIQFLDVYTTNQSLPIIISRSSIYLCSESTKITETHSSVIKGKFSIKDLNGTDNQSDVDSILGLRSNTDGNILKYSIFKDCEAFSHTGIYSTSKSVEITYMNFVNNTHFPNISKYGIVTQYEGNMTITNSNFICPTAGYLFLHSGKGILIVEGCFIEHSWTTTKGDCEVKNNVFSSYEINILKLNLHLCAIGSTKAFAGMNLICSIVNTLLLKI